MTKIWHHINKMDKALITHLMQSFLSLLKEYGIANVLFLLQQSHSSQFENS